MRPQVRLHVEELVLHGLPRYDVPRLTAAFQRELSSRLRALELPPGRSGVTLERLTAQQAVVIGPDERADSVGRQVGQAVWRSFGEGTR
jgi:hypothetical protein